MGYFRTSLLHLEEGKNMHKTRKFRSRSLWRFRSRSGKGRRNLKYEKKRDERRWQKESKKTNETRRREEGKKTGEEINQTATIGGADGLHKCRQLFRRPTSTREICLAKETGPWGGTDELVGTWNMRREHQRQEERAWEREENKTWYGAKRRGDDTPAKEEGLWSVQRVGRQTKKISSI